jgi:signal transduction histidine kinase
VQVDTWHVSGAQVVGSADQLTRAVRNLLDNAAHGGTISVENTPGARFTITLPVWSRSRRICGVSAVKLP